MKVDNFRLICLMLLLMLIPWQDLTSDNTWRNENSSPFASFGFEEAVAKADNKPSGLVEAENVELLGQVGGVTRKVFLRDNFAFIGEGPRLIILDISDPSSPIVAGMTNPFPGIVEGIHVDSDYAYLIADSPYSASLFIVDIQDFSKPTQVGSYSLSAGTSSFGRGIFVSGNLVYVTGLSAGVHILDVSSPTNPIEVGFYNTPGSALNVHVQDNFAYIADASSGMRILDVSSPTNPIEVGSFEEISSVYDVFVNNNYAYIAGFGDGLRIVDVSDPANPVEQGFYDAPNVSAVGIFVNGDYAYVASFQGGLRVVDISNPFEPMEIGTYEEFFTANDVYVINNLAFVADSSAGVGLRILNVTSPTNPIEVGSHFSGGILLDVSVMENVAYMGGNDVVTLSTDVSDPAHPEKIGYYTQNPFPDIQGIDIKESHAYIIGGDGFRIVDINNPVSPTEVGFLSGKGQDVYVMGDFAYVAAADEGLRILDISNPINPTEVGIFDTPGIANGIFVINDSAYIADRDSLRIVDISNPNNPIEVGHYDTPGVAYGVYVSGSTAYVADGAAGLRIVDVSIPSNPTELSAYDPPGGSARKVAVIDSTAYVANLSELLVIDVGDLNNPEQIGYYETVGNAYGVGIVENTIYVASGYGGLYTLQSPSCRRGPDLSIVSVSPVQVVDLNELDEQYQFLVDGKDTAVKVIICKMGDEPIDNVSVQISKGNTNLDQFHVAEAGNTDPNTGRLLFNNIFYPLNFDGGSQTKTVYFFGSDLTPSGSSYQIIATVDSKQQISESYESNNILSSASINVYDQTWGDPNHPNLDLVYFRADWDRSYTEFNEFASYSDVFLKGLFPVAEERYGSVALPNVNYSSSFWRNFGIPPLDNLLNENELQYWMTQMRKVLGLAHPSDDRYVAVVPKGWFAETTTTLQKNIGVTIPNVGGIVLAEAWISEKPNSISSVVHEIGHTAGLPSGCEEEEYEDCNSVDVDGMGNYSASGMFVSQRIPIGTPEEQNIICVMGRPDLSEPLDKWGFWIDANDFETLLNPPTILVTQVAEGTAETQAILASGVVTNNGDVSLDNWYLLGDAQLTPLMPGPYKFEYHDSDNNILQELSFDIQFEVAGIPVTESPFVFVLPFVEGTTKLVVTLDDLPLAEKTISEHAPSVKIISPNGGETLEGTISITWSGNDSDGDSLSYAVLISQDNGTNWETIAIDIEESSFGWDISNFQPSSEYLIKVIATDGFNIGEDITNDSLTVLGKLFLPFVNK